MFVFSAERSSFLKHLVISETNVLNLLEPYVNLVQIGYFCAALSNSVD